MERGPAARSLVIALLVFAAPSFASAQVVINEIMYNPQGADTGREWVELYNQGQTDVTMVGGSGKGSWRLSDGSNHTLTDPAGGTGRGSLTVPAGGYLVIASDPNDFISGEYAGGTYSVVKSSISLNNTGATVALLDGTGTAVDTVTYSPSQGGSDDGSSLQRQADGSWIAALPTPGVANSLTPYVAPQASASTPPQASATSTEQAQLQSGADVSSYVAPPAPSVYADAGGDRTVIVGADVEFDASAYDKDQNVLDPGTTRFLWNFGDGSTAEGDSVLHHFSYPGNYAVILEIANNKNAASAQLTVTAQPAALSFSLLQDGGVGIQNLAGHDLDLSGWMVRQDASSFAAQLILPDHSKVLSGSSMQISPQTLSFRASSSTMLEYPNGTLALAMGESSAASNAVQAAPDTVASDTTKVAFDAAKSPTAEASAVADDPDVADVGTDSAMDSTGSPQADSTSTVLETASVASAPFSRYLWWLGVAAMALAGGAALAAAAHFKKGEWNIIEDKSE